MPFKLKPTPTLSGAAQLEHQRLNSLMNSMTDAVIAVDKAVNIASYNAAALNILDVNNIEVGSPLEKLFKPIDKYNRLVHIKDMVKAAKTPISNRDLRLKYDDGSFIHLFVSLAPVHMGYGSTNDSGHVILLRDITREKSLEEERDEFISVVSHELRTPVAISEGNISNAQLLVEKSKDMPAIKQALEAAHNQVMFLASLINDLSTLSRAERGSLKVEVAAIDVADFINELADNYRPSVEKKGLKLVVKIDPKVQPLRTSNLYAREILQNFVTNAIKYTVEGSITITADALEDGVRFAVADTGIGISKGDQNRVYDKFFRSEDYRTRQANGTGLGLYVTLKLAHLIHARLDLSSELNKGSTFSISIPNLKNKAGGHTTP